MAGAAPAVAMTRNISKPELEPQLKHQCVLDGGVGVGMNEYWTSGCQATELLIFAR